MGTRRKHPQLTLRGLLGIVATVAVVSVTIQFFSNAIEAWKSVDTSAQPKQMCISLQMCAVERDDVFPPFDPRPGRLIFYGRLMYPDYIMSPWLLVSPVDEESVRKLKGVDETDIEAGRQYIDDHSYIYLGYAFTSEAEGLEFVDAYRQQAKLGTGFDTDLPVGTGKGSAGTDTLYRFRSFQIDMGAFLDEHGATKPVVASQISVIIERPGHHRHDPGGWVAFLDGHVEFVTYPGPFPMTAKFIEALESLDALEGAS